jgi:hypothetical protein
VIVIRTVGEDGGSVGGQLQEVPKAGCTELADLSVINLLRLVFDTAAVRCGTWGVNLLAFE